MAWSAIILFFFSKRKRVIPIITIANLSTSMAFCPGGLIILSEFTITNDQSDPISIEPTIRTLLVVRAE